MQDRASLVSARERLASELTTLTSGEAREWTPEEEAKFNALESAVQAIDFRLMAMEEAMDIEPVAPAVEENSASSPEVSAPVENEVPRSTRRAPAMPLGAPHIVRDLGDRNSERDRAMALRGFLLGPNAGRNERAAMMRNGIEIGADRIDLRAQTTTTNSEGGFTVPAGFLAELERKIVYYNPLRQVARVIRTDSGNSLPFPTIDDTSNSAGLGTQNTAPSATDMVFSSVTLSAYRYQSLVILSNELLQDTGIDIVTEVASILGERIGRAEATYHTTGTGSSQPQGVVTGASAGATSTTATAISLANLMSLYNSLDFGYQQNASFMLHQSVWSNILQLADSQSRPLFLDLLNGNQPRLLGYPVIVNNAMASSIAATNVTALFGDFSKYFIRDAGDIQIIRMNERYADQYSTAFLAVRRSDAKVAQSAAIKKLTQSSATTTTTTT
ncbi:MAG: phage major capsid protein [Caulobacteraceae bacterium]|nr:phage major capsid protein [Caulobacteraceae bacterium]